MKILRKTVDEIFADSAFSRLADSYRAESGIDELTGYPSRELYKQLEDAGFLLSAAVVDDAGDLVGFVAVIVSQSLHNSAKRVATVDTLYIDAERRAGSVGLRLIKEAQTLARELGAVGIRYSAPAGSRLETLFSVLFAQTDSIFYKSLEG